MIAFILLIIHTIHGVPTGQYFISTPTNMTVNSGSHARLTCRVGNLAGTCEWTRDGFSLGRDRNLLGYSRYLLAGHREDICHLSIDPVLPIDEGLYQCQVSGGHGVPPITSSPVSLSVNSEPGMPYIMQAMEEAMMEVEEEEEVELQCESQGGRPPAEIQWWDVEGRRIVSDVTEHVKRMDDRKTFKTVSTLKFILHEPISVKCSVNNEAFPKKKYSESLRIKFKGEVELEIKDLSEGESFLINCEEKDSHTKYKWFINQKELISEKGRSLEIEHFVAAYHNSLVKCLGEDKMGKLEVLKMVKLLHDPNKNKNVQIKEALIPITNNNGNSNKEATRKRSKISNSKKTIFTCVTEEDTSEQPKYVWMKGKLEGKVVAADAKNRKFNCEIVPSGYQKLNQMGRNMKSMSRTFKKFRKTFNKIVTYMESA